MTDSTKCSCLRLCLCMASARCGYYIADIACRFLRYQASVRNVRWVTVPFSSASIDMMRMLHTSWYEALTYVHLWTNTTNSRPRQMFA
jgi:hypothetical protein